MEAMSAQAILRPRRQITLPRGVCDELGIAPGDRLDVEVRAGSVLLRPAKRRALDALKEIQDAFARARITEKELQEEGRSVRRQLTAERYGKAS